MELNNTARRKTIQECFALREDGITEGGSKAMQEPTEKPLIGSGITCRTSMEKRALPTKVAR